MPTDKRKKSRGNVKNLKMWKPGQSGNPKGRPKGAKSLNDLLRKIGDEKLEGTDLTKREAVMRKVYKLAYEGKPWAVQFIADRTEGKAVETVRTQEVKDELIIE